MDIQPGRGGRHHVRGGKEKREGKNLDREKHGGLTETEGAWAMLNGEFEEIIKLNKR